MSADQEKSPKVGSVVSYAGKTYKIMSFNLARDQVDIRPHPSGGVEIRVPVGDVQVTQ